MLERKEDPQSIAVKARARYPSLTSSPKEDKGRVGRTHSGTKEPELHLPPATEAFMNKQSKTKQDATSAIQPSTRKAAELNSRKDKNEEEDDQEAEIEHHRLHRVVTPHTVVTLPREEAPSPASTSTPAEGASPTSTVSAQPSEHRPSLYSSDSHYSDSSAGTVESDKEAYGLLRQANSGPAPPVDIFEEEGVLTPTKPPSPSVDQVKRAREVLLMDRSK